MISSISTRINITIEKSNQGVFKLKIKIKQTYKKLFCFFFNLMINFCPFKKIYAKLLFRGLLSWTCTAAEIGKTGRSYFVWKTRIALNTRLSACFRSEVENLWFNQVVMSIWDLETTDILINRQNHCYVSL